MKDNVSPNQSINVTSFHLKNRVMQSIVRRNVSQDKSMYDEADAVDKCGAQGGKEETTPPSLWPETETNLSSFLI